MLSFWTYLLLAPVLGLLILIGLLNYKKSKSSVTKKLKIGFFHPFCNDAGGGQKVLWCIVKALLSKKDYYEIAIYSVDGDKQKILQKAENRFDIQFSKQDKESLKIIHVMGRGLLVPQRVLTMLFHIVLPMLYTMKCLWKYQPDVFYDTTGFAFNFFLVKLVLPTTKCFAYVHYPFISKDMVQKIQQRRQDYNNRQTVSKSALLTKLKLIYYKIILFNYMLVGHVTYFAQTNSSWTFNHMRQLWGKSIKEHRLVKLYPPCSVAKFLNFQKDYKSNIIMSLAQFRPQKNQLLQLQVLKTIVSKYKGDQKMLPKLRICGTTRSPDDERILNDLIKRAQELQIKDNVQFRVNMPYSGVLQCLHEANIGIHTMEAEHFGISVVEMMAAGMLVVAHNSAGPKEDIIRNQQYLALTQQDYEDKIMRIIQLSPQERSKVVKQNRSKSEKFGQVYFMEDFMQGFEANVQRLKKLN